MVTKSSKTKKLNIWHLPIAVSNQSVTTWQVWDRGAYANIEKMPLKKKNGFGHKQPKNEKNWKRAKMLRHQSVPAHGETALGKPTRPPATHKVRQPKCPVLGHLGPKHVTLFAHCTVLGTIFEPVGRLTCAHFWICFRGGGATPLNDFSTNSAPARTHHILATT